MQKHITELTPQELNSFLLERLNLGLYPFSCFLERIISLNVVHFGFKPDPNYEKMLKEEKAQAERLYSNNPKIKELELDKIHSLEKEYNLGIKIKPIYELHDVKKLNSLKRRLLNLKKKIIETMIDCTVYFDGDTKQKERYKNVPYKEFEKTFAWEYELEPFLFGLVDQYISDIDEHLVLAKKGSPINKRNLLISMWVLFLIDRGKIIDWILLNDIFIWFWKKLSPYKLYKGLKPSQESDSEYFKNQFYKHKKRWNVLYTAHGFRAWWHARQQVIILGQLKNEIDRYPKMFLDYFINGTGKPLDGHDNKTFLPFVIKLYKENPNFNNMVIFPDYSYLIT